MSSFRDSFVDALEAYRSANNGGEGEWKRYWDDLEIASRSATRAFDVAIQFGQSQQPERIHVAVDLMGLVAEKNPHLQDRVADMVLSLVHERSEEPLIASAAHALGATESLKAVPFLVGCLDTDSPSVRVSAAIGLVGFVGRSRTALLAASHAVSDRDPDVRFWATFAVAMKTDVDTSEIRDLLAKSLFDSDDEVRNEAIRGLARRGDERARSAIETALRQSDPAEPILQAAAFLGISTDLDD